MEVTIEKQAAASLARCIYRCDFFASDEETAEWLKTPDGIHIQQSYREKLNAEARRAQALADAAELIENLFGTGAAEDAEPVNDEALEMLKAGAALVYDRQLVSQQLAVTYTIRAKIARNTKGNLTIERKDTSSSKLEV